MSRGSRSARRDFARAGINVRHKRFRSLALEFLGQPGAAAGTLQGVGDLGGIS
jgi:hypothetical protein